MPPRKKPDVVSEVVAARAAERPAAKSEFSEPVKLREAFKMDLQTVSLRMKIPMGDLIERLNYQYIQTMLTLVGQGKPIQAPPPRPGAG